MANAHHTARILGLGEVTIDKSYVLQGYPVENTKVDSSKVHVSVGGPVVAGVTLLARMGYESIMRASVGRDAYGEVIGAHFEAEGIELSVQPQSENKVHTYLVNGERGTRTGIKSPVVHTPLTLGGVGLDGLRAVMFDRHEPDLYEQVVCQIGSEVIVMLDPSTCTLERTMRMLQRATVPVLPIESVGKLRSAGRLGMSNGDSFSVQLGKLLGYLGKSYVLTCGEWGALVVEAGRLVAVPALDIRCVDALGAGDVFRGAFVYGLLQGWGLVACTRYAVRVSGLQCLQVGNHSAIPTLEQIAASMVQFRHRDMSQDTFLSTIYEECL